MEAKYAVQEEDVDVIDGEYEGDIADLDLEGAEVVEEQYEDPETGELLTKEEAEWRMKQAELWLAEQEELDAKRKAKYKSLCKARTPVSIQMAAADGFDFDTGNSRNETLLMKFAAQGDLAIVIALIRAGASVNAEDASQRTAAHWADSAFMFDVLERLVIEGAEFDGSYSQPGAWAHRRDREKALRRGREQRERGLVICLESALGDLSVHRNLAWLIVSYTTELTADEHKKLAGDLR
jgi:hypothetical protein